MTPNEMSEALVQLADYIDNNEQVSVSTIKGGLSHISAGTYHQAGFEFVVEKGKNFVKHTVENSKKLKKFLENKEARELVKENVKLLKSSEGKIDSIIRALETQGLKPNIPQLFEDVDNRMLIAYLFPIEEGEKTRALKKAAKIIKDSGKVEFDKGTLQEALESEPIEFLLKIKPSTFSTVSLKLLDKQINDLQEEPRRYVLAIFQGFLEVLKDKTHSQLVEYVPDEKLEESRPNRRPKIGRKGTVKEVANPLTYVFKETLITPYKDEEVEPADPEKVERAEETTGKIEKSEISTGDKEILKQLLKDPDSQTIRSRDVPDNYNQYLEMFKDQYKKNKVIQRHIKELSPKWGREIRDRYNLDDPNMALLNAVIDTTYGKIPPEVYAYAVNELAGENKLPGVSEQAKEAALNIIKDTYKLPEQSDYTRDYIKFAQKRGVNDSQRYADALEDLKKESSTIYKSLKGANKFYPPSTLVPPPQGKLELNVPTPLKDFYKSTEKKYPMGIEISMDVYTLLRHNYDALNSLLQNYEDNRKTIVWAIANKSKKKSEDLAEFDLKYRYSSDHLEAPITVAGEKVNVSMKKIKSFVRYLKEQDFLNHSSRNSDEVLSSYLSWVAETQKNYIKSKYLGGMKVLNDPEIWNLLYVRGEGNKFDNNKTYIDKNSPVEVLLKSVRSYPDDITKLLEKQYGSNTKDSAAAREILENGEKEDIEFLFKNGLQEINPASARKFIQDTYNRMRSDPSKDLDAAAFIDELKKKGIGANTISDNIIQASFEGRVYLVPVGSDIGFYEGTYEADKRGFISSITTLYTTKADGSDQKMGRCTTVPYSGASTEDFKDYVAIPEDKVTRITAAYQKLIDTTNSDKLTKAEIESALASLTGDLKILNSKEELAVCVDAPKRIAVVLPFNLLVQDTNLWPTSYGQRGRVKTVEKLPVIFLDGFSIKKEEKAKFDFEHEKATEGSSEVADLDPAIIKQATDIYNKLIAGKKGPVDLELFRSNLSGALDVEKHFRYLKSNKAACLVGATSGVTKAYVYPNTNLCFENDHWRRLTPGEYVTKLESPFSFVFDWKKDQSSDEVEAKFESARDKSDQELLSESKLSSTQISAACEAYNSVLSKTESEIRPVGLLGALTDKLQNDKIRVTFARNSIIIFKTGFDTAVMYLFPLATTCNDPQIFGDCENGAKVKSLLKPAIGIVSPNKPGGLEYEIKEAAKVEIKDPAEAQSGSTKAKQDSEGTKPEELKESESPDDEWPEPPETYQQKLSSDLIGVLNMSLEEHAKKPKGKLTKLIAKNLKEYFGSENASITTVKNNESLLMVSINKTSYLVPATNSPKGIANVYKLTGPKDGDVITQIISLCRIDEKTNKVDDKGEAKVAKRSGTKK